jgi:hypothetical protein
MGITIISAVSVLFGLTLNSCDSEDGIIMNKSEQSGNIIKLSDGSKIELTDTTTYLFNLTELIITLITKLQLVTFSLLTPEL